MKTPLWFTVACILPLLLPSGPARAEEKNGLSVMVAKVTVEKKDAKAGYSDGKGYYESTNRTQALKVTIKNTSFKPMPEGELEWKILVVGAWASHLQTGSEKVKALKPANIQELVIGNAEVSGLRKGTSKREDKVEWQITVKQGETEIIKTQSCPDFDALAKGATKAHDKDAGAGAGKDGGKK